MPSSKLLALINLLDDPDKQVHHAVMEQLLSAGESIIPDLEEAWESSANQDVQYAIEQALQQIQYHLAYNGLKKWIDNGGKDILEGAYWVAKHKYPDLIYKQLEREVDMFKNEAWLEIDEIHTALEKVRIINYFIYDIHHYKNEKNFPQPAFCFINQVIETKKGNPITLAILYMAVCQRLDLPVYGVCIPRNFLLAYQDEFSSQVLFYLNPFYNGTPLTAEDIKQSLNQIHIKINNAYFKPRSNLTTILRLVETLIFIYEQEGNQTKADVYRKLVPLFGNLKTYFQEDNHEEE